MTMLEALALEYRHNGTPMIVRCAHVPMCLWICRGAPVAAVCTACAHYVQLLKLDDLPDELPSRLMWCRQDRVPLPATIFAWADGMHTSASGEWRKA